MAQEGLWELHSSSSKGRRMGSGEENYPVALTTAAGGTSTSKSTRGVPDTQQSHLRTQGSIYADCGGGGSLPNCHWWMGCQVSSEPEGETASGQLEVGDRVLVRLRPQN